MDDVKKLKPKNPTSSTKKKKTTVMSGTSGAVRECEVWCYTKREDKVESAVRAVSASVRSAAASHQGASVWVWAKEDTETAMQKLRGHLGIDVGKITEPQEADVYVEMRVGTGVGARGPDGARGKRGDGGGEARGIQAGHGCGMVDAAYAA
jgi:hypothetical protein